KILRTRLVTLRTLFLHSRQSQKDHQRKSHRSDDNLRKADVRRLEDEKHDTEQKAVKAKHHRLRKRLAVEDHGSARRGDKDQNSGLQDCFANLCSSANGMSS